MNTTPWSLTDDTLTLYCHVQPGARHNRIVGLHDRRIKVQLKAPPVDGQANRELTRLLADLCACAAADIRIRQGASSRKKTIQIKGINVIPEKLDELIP